MASVSLQLCVRARVHPQCFRCFTRLLSVTSSDVTAPRPCGLHRQCTVDSQLSGTVPDKCSSLRAWFLLELTEGLG